MVKITQELSSKLSNICFVCTCLVVLIHVPSIKTGSLINDFIIKWIQTGLSMIAVPLFFIMSGLLLGRHIYEVGWYRRAIISRVKSLLIPFFALNLLWFPVKYSIHWIGVRYFGADGSNRLMDFTFYNFLYGVGLIPWGGNVVIGFWYVRVLFYLVLVSPFIAWFVRKGKVASMWLIVALLGLWCLQSRIHISSVELAGAMKYTFCFRCPLFFTIGMVCALYAPKTLPRFLIMLLVPMAIGSLILVKSEVVVYDASISTLINFIAIILISIALWSITPSRKWPPHLTGNSFPVFALHGMILYLLPIPMKVFGIGVGTYPILLLFIVTIFIAILVAEVLKKHLPCFANVIFGGR